MASADSLVQQARAALKANRKSDAKALLEQALEIDESNEQVWLYMSGCVESLDDQITCLENVLALNPKNERATRGLEELKRKKGGRKSPAAPAQQPTPPPPDDPFAGSPFEMELGPGTTAAPASSSSVDWGKDPLVPAYGSGKNVQLPSDEEYDNWLTNLPLGGESGSGSSPFIATTENFDPTSGPFTTTNFDETYEPAPTDNYGFDPFNQASSPPADSNPGYDTGGTQYSDPYADNQFDAPMFDSYDQFADTSAEVESPNLGTSFSFRQGSPTADPTEPQDDFDFGLTDDFGESETDRSQEAAPSASPASSSKLFAGPKSGGVFTSGNMMLGASPLKPATSQAFKAIPSEIQVESVSSSLAISEGVKLLGIVAVLGVGNAISAIVLLINLLNLGR